MASSSSSSSPEIPHSLPEPSETLDDVLEELSTRFIMNLPDQELESVERMCFQVEQAHWYYEDFMREANPKLPSFNLKKFSSIFFNSCPLLRQWSAEHEQYFNTFMQYKVRVPVCGAIMLNDKWDKCILVKGWKSSAGWGFPKGKINQNEPPHECAAREVAEETGFNISSYLRPDDYIEMTIREQRVTLFIVGGIPENYPFQPRTRKEISKIQWFKLSDLPSWKRNKQVPGKFYLISPFVHALKEFIRVNKPTRRRQNRRKSGNESIPELAIRTPSEANDATEGTEAGDQHGPRAVSLDRDTNGYSSSSVDNGEPHTPSPQSSEALPVGTGVYRESKSEPPMDPHFARLLNGLTLSASKPVLKEETRANSITPTSAQSSLSSARGDYADTPRQPTNEEHCSSNGGAICDAASTSCIKSPSDSGRSDSSAMTARPQSAQPLSSATAFASHRHLKHLALLESVAQEAAASTAVPGERQQNHPGQPSSVPPLPFNPPGLPSILGLNTRVFNGDNTVASNVSGQLVQTHVNNHHMIRPVTSQSLYPPPSVLHRGSNRNMQQGSLLSILSGTGIPPPAPQRFVGRPESWNGHGILPRAGGQVHPPAFVSPIQPLRVMPPPRGSFQLNPGPLTAPLVPPGQPQSSFVQHGNNAASNPHKATASNAAQLLLLLNPSPSMPSTVAMNRPDFQQGPTH